LGGGGAGKVGGEERKSTTSTSDDDAPYRSLFEHMLDGFAYCRMLYRDGRPDDFVYLRVNHAFEALTGLRGAEGRRATEVSPKIRESSPELIERYGRVVESGRPERFEIELPAQGIWLAIAAYRPEPEHFVAVFSDITARKRAEADRDRVLSALQQAAEPVLITDAAGAIEYVNPAFEAVTGWTAKEAVGQNPRILRSGHQSDAFYRAMWETLLAGEVWRGRMVNTRKDGRLITIEATISPVRDARGKVMHYVAVQRDITREIDLEQQIIEAQKLESLGRLAGGVAHDFNNLLAVIMNCTEFVLEALDPNDPSHADLEESRNAAVRAAALVRQLLAFSRRQILQPALVDVSVVVASVASMLGRVLGEDVKLLLETATALPKVRVDPGQLEQVLMNLAVNARDAMPRGGTLTIATDEMEIAASDATPNPGRYVRLTMRDSGFGMDEATLARIFEPFFTTKAPGRGTGLGLSTVYGIVKQSGGHVLVRSEPGAGTTFEILLPVAVGNPRSFVPSRMPKRTIGSETILVVEDEEQVRRITRRILEASGYVVLTAASGEDALDVCTKHEGTIHLLVTDVVLPGMSGRELANRIAHLRPETALLYMSGYTNDAISDHGVLDEGTHLLPKPFDVVSLTTKVREVLDFGR